MAQESDHKTFIYIIGGIVGAIAGLAATYLLLKNQQGKPDQKSLITSKDGLKIGISLASMLKQIADLGKK
jgi:gas vesicle protein